MNFPAAFLGGAKSRLLPASVPFSFFAAAAVFHVLAWLALFASADELGGYTGGPGVVLAAIHLLTLGVLVMTVMGAAFQLLPVASRTPLSRVWPARLCFWLLATGTLLLSVGMAANNQGAMYWGGIVVSASLSLFAIIFAGNLRHARDMAIVASHGWGAIGALAGLVVLGLVLIADFSAGFLPNHQSLAVAHMLIAGFGFMGLMAFGFSHILVPMFALSRAMPQKPGWLQFWLFIFACAFAVASAMVSNTPGLILAAVIGLGAGGVYLWLMRLALKSGMRKRLGLSFLMIKISWCLLILCLALGLALALGAPVPNGGVLFGFLLLCSWLLTFLTGVLQRIMPFLASMHAAGKGAKPALLSELTAEVPLKVHAFCHLAAIALCTVGIILDAAMPVMAGAGLGLAGAIAFAVFAGRIIFRLHAAHVDGKQTLAAA